MTAWRRRAPLAIAVSAIALTVGVGQVGAAPKRPSPPAGPTVAQWILPNGLGVVFLAVHRAPVAALQVWYHVGAKEEPRDRRGLARFVERLMWTGSGAVAAGEHARALEAVGGQTESMTTEDATAFLNVVPRNHLDLVAHLEADRMRGLVLTPAALESQRETLRRDLRSRGESNPVVGAFERFRELAFGRHPYAWTPRGKIADLEAVTADDVRHFYDAYYLPNNATLVIVGDVTEEAARVLAERWFGRLSRGADPPRPSRDVAEAVPAEALRETIAPADVGMVIGGFRIAPARSADAVALEVLARILAEGETSRLAGRIVHRDGSGMEPGQTTRVLEESGFLLIYVATRRVADAAKVEAGIQDEIVRLQKKPVGKDELARARNQLAARASFATEDVAGLARALGAAKLLVGDAAAGLDQQRRYQSVTAKDVMRVAKNYLAARGATFVIMPPSGDVAGGGKP